MATDDWTYMMDGRYSKGVRYERDNCSRSSEVEGFDARIDNFRLWLKNSLVPKIISSGLASHGFCYRMMGVEPGDPTYLSIYELEQDNLEALAQEFETQFEEWRRRGQINSSMERVDAATWRRTGPEFVSSGPERATVSGLLAIEAMCTDPNRVEEYNEWYNGTHVPDMLSTGLYHTAYRFENISPEQGRGAYLALYETDQDPQSAQQTFWQDFRPMWIETGRVIDTMKVISARSYQPI